MYLGQFSAINFFHVKQLFSFVDNTCHVSKINTDKAKKSPVKNLPYGVFQCLRRFWLSFLHLFITNPCIILSIIGT